MQLCIFCGIKCIINAIIYHAILIRVYCVLYYTIFVHDDMENTDIIKLPIVCAHKSFCFSFGM